MTNDSTTSARVRLVLSAVAVLSMAGCLGSGAARPNVTARAPDSPASPLQQLRGEWTLVGFDAQGPRRASGRLTFDEFNNIVIRAELAPGEAGATPPRVVVVDFTAKASAAGRDALTYLGLETRSPQDAMVPLGADAREWRHFTVSGDTLTLWQEDSRGQRLGTLTFSRVR